MISPLLINAARTVYISEFKNIDQDYETSQSQKLPQMYGLCIYEIKTIDSWSNNIEEKIIRFKSANSNDIKCIGRIIGSSEPQGQEINILTKNI